MTDQIENLILDPLRSPRADIAGIRETQAEHGLRLDDLARALAGIRRDHAGDAEAVAHLQAQLDRLRGQVDRINRRLDIAD